MILDKKTLEMISVFEDGVAAMRRGMEYLEELPEAETAEIAYLRSLDVRSL
jgi:hypothetical protein